MTYLTTSQPAPVPPWSGHDLAAGLRALAASLESAGANLAPLRSWPSSPVHVHVAVQSPEVVARVAEAYGTEVRTTSAGVTITSVRFGPVREYDGAPRSPVVLDVAHMDLPT